MQLLNVVIAISDPKAAADLASKLNPHFHSVAVARSADEARNAIPKHRAELAVIDLETVGIEEVEQLCRDFRNTSVVCTHRLADDEMWSLALEAGAIDCCFTEDVGGILQAVNRNVRVSKATAA